jgi:hypothetical protein
MQRITVNQTLVDELTAKAAKAARTAFKESRQALVGEGGNV